MRRYITSALMGVLGMTAVNLTAVFTGISIPFSGLSLMISALLGLPGVAGILITNYLII